VIYSRLTKGVVAVLVALLTSLGLTAITPVTSASALDGKNFDPGLIISDSVFFDFGTMTAEDIQRFLDSQVPVCGSGPTGMPCLKNYKTDTPEKIAEVGKCQYMPAQKNISAAQIIFNISRACGINPRVLLVTLQKEQGLVQAKIPSPYMYRAAMGYGCPDSDPGICGKVWTGLFNQLYKAAGQFQWYGDPNGSFTYLRPGRQVSISYHPDAARACGKQSFTLKSQATANLYYYTPFVPNKASLGNLRGTGDRCSSYGNRNFWRFYWDWFGSPIGGGFLLKSATSDPYFISNDIKYPLSDPDLVKELAPLGPLGEISKEYLDSFKTGIPLTRIIKTAPVNNVSTYFFISGGKKYLISNCEQATNLGLDCQAAVALTQVQLDALPTGPFRSDITGVVKGAPVAPATTSSFFLVNETKKYPVDCAKIHLLGFTCTNAKELKQAELDALLTVRLSAAALGISSMLNLTDGSRVLLRAGEKREVLDDASLTAEGIGSIAPSPLKLKDFDYLPWGLPVALDGSLFANKDLKRDAVLAGGVMYDIDPETRKEIDFTKIFRATTGTLSTAGMSKVPEAKPLGSLIVDDNEHTWLLSKSGKTKVESTSTWVKKAAEVPNSLAEKFPTTEDVITGANFIKADTQKTVFLLKDGVIRATFNEADRAILATGLSSTKVIPVSVSGLSFIPRSVMVLPPGLVVKNKQTGVVGIIDSPSSMIAFNDKSMKLKLAEARILTTIQLVGYPSATTFGPYKLSCAGQIYVVANSFLHETKLDVAKELPGVSTKLSDAVCSQLTITDKSFGRYIGHSFIDPVSKKTIKKAYKIVKGKRLPFINLAQYKLDNLTEPPLIWVDDDFIKNLPLGAQMPVKSTVVPKPPIVTQPKTYTIVAGDTLTLIATRFKTTVARLMELNNLVNSDRIRIGQVLKLP
jgi:LysM repeat protein